MKENKEVLMLLSDKTLEKKQKKSHNQQQLNFLNSSMGPASCKYFCEETLLSI